MITTPLRTLLESNDISIEDMSQHYLQLSSYLADASQNVTEFMKGDFPPFTNRYLENDQIYEFLKKDSIYDTDVEVILRIFLPSIRNVVLHVYKDHLPNGRYEHFTDDLSKITQSVDKHNSFSERLFGNLDQILKTKPNISTLAAEAYAMFLMNKTAYWIQNCDFNLTSVVSDARKSVNSERGLFQRRKREIQRQREQKQQEEFQKKAEVKRRRLNRLEKQSDEIIIYGLWKTPREYKQKLKKYRSAS